jgi:hypothetical protein
MGNTRCHKRRYSALRGVPFGYKFPNKYLIGIRLFNSVIKRGLFEKLVVEVVKKLSAL